jgi:phospholipase C
VQKAAIRWVWMLLVLICVAGLEPAFAQTGLQKVNHIIIVMQENHSFDNYFGALAYAPGSPYHAPNNANGGCSVNDHMCVDGLSCMLDASGALHCFNSNNDDNGGQVFAFHDASRCVSPDLNHSWFPTHQEANYSNPDSTLGQSLNNGFVLVNDQTEQIDNGAESTTDDQTMGFYNQDDIPFYYDLAQKFAMSDRHFASVLGPTFPNRSYLMAATSFGHLTTNDTFPPLGTGYKPITGTIFDLLDKNGVTWADYFQDAPQGASFRLFSPTSTDPHFLPLSVFLAQAAAGSLPSVSFVDPNFGLSGTAAENDEHPPTDIQRGQAYVSQVINAVHNGPNWKDSIIFLTYDEHGGFYDHAAPPPAPQDHALTPDGIAPGQCADLSNPPTSEQPGGGAECASNPLSTTDTSVKDAILLCPAMAANPTGPYPADCPNFNQLGIRIPFVAISPFSRPHYVSHTIGDHTSMLALIEKRFLPTVGSHGTTTPAHLTLRDQYANTLEDMLDFANSPSLNVPVTQAQPPTNDCTPLKLP